jgi:membrane associated rhomboid family serine protease
MGLADRHYMRQSSGGLNWSATLVLILALVIAFIVKLTVLTPGFTGDYLALSVPGIQRGFIWELLTFQFLHDGWIHLLLNCWAIFLFGRELEWTLGKARFLTLYFASGVIGGLLQIMGAWIWPTQLGGSVVGASAGAFGLVAAFAMRDPERQLTMLLYFILPLRLRAKTLLIISIVLAGLGIAFPRSMFGGHIAHLAHLGGILTGVVWMKLGWHRDYIRLPWEGWLDRWQQWRSSRKQQPKRELINAPAAKLSRWRPQPEASELPSEEFISREVDPILDKISAHGIQSLTERERKILEAARNRMAKR